LLAVALALPLRRLRRAKDSAASRPRALRRRRARPSGLSAPRRGRTTPRSEPRRGPLRRPGPRTSWPTTGPTRRCATRHGVIKSTTDRTPSSWTSRRDATSATTRRCRWPISRGLRCTRATTWPRRSRRSTTPAAKVGRAARRLPLPRLGKWALTNGHMENYLIHTTSGGAYNSGNYSRSFTHFAPLLDRVHRRLPKGH